MAEPQGQSPLGGLLSGIVQGYGLRQQMLQWKQQNQEAATKAALDEQNASVKDITTRMMLQGAGRPVIDGMVEDATAPSIQRSTTTPAPAPPATAPPDGDGPSVEQLQNLPETQTRVNPSVPILRKADRSRTVPYQDRQGNTTETELYTPEEQQQRDAAAAQQKFRATAIHVTADADQQKAFGIPADAYIQPEHYASYMQATGQWKPTQTTDAQQAFGASPTVPQRDLGKVIANTGAGQRAAGHDTSRENIEGERDQTREDIAGQSNSAKAGISSAANALRKAIDDSDNKTKKDIAAGAQAGANSRAAGAQAGANSRAAGVQAGANSRQGNRLTAAQAAQQQKQLQALQAQEDNAQAARVQMKADIANPNTPDLVKKTRTEQLSSNAYQIQSYQTRKAAVAGAQAPPKAKQDAIKEGETVAAPDGHVWQKKDGIVLFVK